MSESDLSRRKFLTASGVTLFGATLATSKAYTNPLAIFGGGDGGNGDSGGRTCTAPGVISKDKLLKPVYVPEPGNTDPMAHSIADNLFWNDIMMEHAMFFVMLMPGPELAGPRRQAEQFQRKFQRQFDKTCETHFNSNSIKEFNRSTIALARSFRQYKLRMLQLQKSGQLKSLVFPLLFDHTAREADRFARRLELYNSGSTALHLAEVADFWTEIMADHADFTAHLLDPTERALVAQAFQTSQAFRALENSTSRPTLQTAGEQIIDFKTAAEKGILAGEIQSIIHPALADHVRREAIKFVDELKRT